MLKIFKTVLDMFKNENRDEENLLDQSSRQNNTKKTLTYYGQFTTIYNYNLCDLTSDVGLSDIIDLNEKIKANLKEYQDRSERFVAVSKCFCLYKINLGLVGTFKEILRISKIYKKFFIENTFWFENDNYEKLRINLEEQRHDIIIKNFKAIKKTFEEYRKVLKELIGCFMGLSYAFQNVETENPIFRNFMNDIKTFSYAVIPHGEELKNIKRFLTDLGCLKVI